MVQSNPHPLAFVLTSHVSAYQKALAVLGLEGNYQPDIGSLIEAVLDAVACPGVIVDVHEVMAADRRDRDRLFRLADRVHILRSKMDVASGQIIFIDDLSSLHCPPQERIPYFRASERIPVNLAAHISNEDDPAMVYPNPVCLKDISEGGCFLRLEKTPPVEDFLHLRLSDTANPLPIFCNIRWRALAGLDQRTHGVGVKFMEIKPDQIVEIKARFIEPAIGQQ